MKILYAIQGTGNGHFSRARDIVPVLQQKGEVDILISGTEADVDFPFEVQYRCKGLSFVFGKNGGIDILETYKKSNLKNLFEEIKSLPVDNYHIVISDFEPVSAWACRFRNKKCIGLSHQAGVINKKSPKPKNSDLLGKAILKHYAPVDIKYGFHFKSYDKNIFKPVIRKEVRDIYSYNNKHYTVYLPAYGDKQIIKVLQEIKNTKWIVFSKHSKKEYSEGNIYIHPVNNNKFLESLASAEGILCGAGFETPAEALFLRKKLLVIPMKGQYEQQCNAAALKKMGVPVIKTLKKKYLDRIKEWIKSPQNIKVDYPDSTEKIITTILKRHLAELPKTDALPLGTSAYSVKKFREINLKKIINDISGAA